MWVIKFNSTDNKFNTQFSLFLKQQGYNKKQFTGIDIITSTQTSEASKLLVSQKGIFNKITDNDPVVLKVHLVEEIFMATLFKNKCK